MSEPTQPEHGIQTGAPPAAPETAIQEGTPTPDTIPLPPMPAAEPTPAAVATGWSTFDVLLFLMLGTLCAFFGSFVLTNNDFWLHVATGRAIADGTHQFGVDPFSFGSVRDGAPVLWVNHAWLYDLGMYGLYSSLGGRGVAIFQATLMVALFFLVVQIGARGIRPMSAMLLAGLTLLVVSQRMGATPMTMSYLMFGVLFLLLRRGGLLGAMTSEEQPSRWALYGLPLLFVLWVNLDGWFILGLASMGLLILGNAIAGACKSCPLRTQGLILLVCVVACLLNPFHVRALILPPEMAYALGPVPAAVGPGGETLRALQHNDPDFLVGLGYVWPFHPSFFPSSAQTFSIARAAYYALLVLSLASFRFWALATRRPGGSGWPIGRFLAWALAAFLGGTFVLLIPLFAVIAGPIMIMNLAEFVHSRRQSSPVEPDLLLLNPNLARFAVFVLVLVALGLAWPGWLHSPIGERSTRRVAWQLQADPSLKATAEALSKAGAEHVFNTTTDVAHYCAWFAPGVRCYMDQRLGLFAWEAARYAKMRKQLRENAGVIAFDQRRPETSDWPEGFRTLQIDHLIITRFGDLQSANAMVLMCWLQQWHWTPRHADGKTLAFAWSASGQGDGGRLPETLERAAFGRVPAERRAPLGGANPPQTAPSLSAIYLEGQPAFASLDAYESNVHLLYFNLARERWRSAYEPIWQLATWAAPAGLGGAGAGCCLGTLTDVDTLWMERFVFPRMLAPDLGPPAAPLLMIRAARRALADNPNEARAHLALYHAYRLQNSYLEDRWIALTGHPPEPNERTQVRQVQMVMALRNYLDLRPDDWQVRQLLAELFYQMHQLDAG